MDYGVPEVRLRTMATTAPPPALSGFRVLMVAFNFDEIGGIQAYVREMTRALTLAGAVVDVACPMQAGDRQKDGVCARGLMPAFRLLRPLLRSVLPLWLEARLRLRRTRYDLVVLSHIQLAESLLRYLNSTKTPYWVNAYGIEIWQKWSTKGARAISNAQRIVAISNFTREKLLERDPSLASKTVIIPPPIDTNFFTPSEHASEGSGRHVLLSVGRLDSQERYKGQDLVIAALGRMGERARDIEYRIIGEGSDRSRLESLAQAEGISAQVRFEGPLEDRELVRAYQKCDIHVLPSYVNEREDGSWTGEGFGIVYAEAAACGKPSIACSRGGQTDIVIEGRSGILVEPTAAAVQHAIETLLADPRQRAQLGRGALSWVREKFSQTSFHRRVQELARQTWANAPLCDGTLFHTP
ncbi:MAG: glycosyltransferase family 4 protein [Planctomycetes bacterium]|nr:glycosyltransferase family 4 protein [Planctomycetota bacterium]